MCVCVCACARVCVCVCVCFLHEQTQRGCSLVVLLSKSLESYQLEVTKNKQKMGSLWEDIYRKSISDAL